MFSVKSVTYEIDGEGKVRTITEKKGDEAWQKAIQEEIDSMNFASNEFTKTIFHVDEDGFVTASVIVTKAGIDSTEQTMRAIEIVKRLNKKTAVHNEKVK